MIYIGLKLKILNYHRIFNSVYMTNHSFIFGFMLTVSFLMFSLLFYLIIFDEDNYESRFIKEEFSVKDIIEPYQKELENIDSDNEEEEDIEEASSSVEKTEPEQYHFRCRSFSMSFIDDILMNKRKLD